MSDFNAVANHSLKQKSRVQGIGTYFLPIPMSKYKLEAATSISEQDAHAAADVPAGKIEEGNNTTGPGEKPLGGEIVGTDRRRSSVVEKRETFIETFINRKSIIELLNGPNQLARKSVTLYYS